MNAMAKILTDESKLVLTNGTVIEGAEKVGNAVLNICEVYRKAYNAALLGYALKGAGATLVVVGVSYVAIKWYNQDSEK
jgi:hypothetical protein